MSSCAVFVLVLRVADPQQACTGGTLPLLSSSLVAEESLISDQSRLSFTQPDFTLYREAGSTGNLDNLRDLPITRILLTTNVSLIWGAGNYLQLYKGRERGLNRSILIQGYRVSSCNDLIAATSDQLQTVCYTVCDILCDTVCDILCDTVT